MARLLCAAVALVAYAMSGAVQSLADVARNAEEARKRATAPSLTITDRDLDPSIAFNELLGFEFDPARWRRFVDADRRLARVFSGAPEVFQRFGALPSTTSIRAFERFFQIEPALAGALEAAGTPPREYVYAHLAVKLATAESGKFPETLPPAVRANVVFLKSHQAEARGLSVPSVGLTLHAPRPSIAAAPPPSVSPKTPAAPEARGPRVLDPPRDDDGAIEVREGAAVPDFEFTDFEGRARRLSEFRGKYVLLDFWGSWCGPCRAEVPFARAAYDRFRGRGFEILGLNYERSAGTDQVRALLQQGGVNWTFATADSVRHLIVKRFHVSSFPTLLLLDPDGVIVESNSHRLRGETLANTLDRVLPR